MKINLNAIQKSLVMALAAVCISLPMANISEAAPAKHVPPHRQEKQVSDVHFFRGQPPKHHKACKNPYHARWAPHFHCSKSYHHHDDHRPARPLPPPSHHHNH